jgi:hypothetical protein
MDKKSPINAPAVPDGVLWSKIHLIRGLKVMLDFDLAELYEVETRALKQAVKRNIDRFPADFMFQLTKTEWKEVITNCDNLPEGVKYSPATPFSFTEHGVLMLSSVVNSDRAIKVNIQVMRIYVHMREMMMLNKDILHRLESIERNINGQERKFRTVFEYLKQFEQTRQQELKQKDRPRIGYKASNV